MVWILVKSGTQVLGFALCFIFITVGTLVAHEPLASWTAARLSSDALTLEVVLTPGEARLLLAHDVDDVPYVYPGRFDEIRALFLKHAVSDLFYLAVDGETLVLDRADVVYDAEKDDVVFWLFYPRPKGESVEFRAYYLDVMPEEHEATLVVFGEAGKSLGWELLIKGNDQFRVALSHRERQSWGTSFRLAVAVVFLPLLLAVKKRADFFRYGESVFSLIVAMIGGYWFMIRVFY